jgi:hypothetical protein
MALCSKCGLPFSYAEPHICEGRDRTKLWFLSTALIAAIAGAIVGGALGHEYIQAVIRRACEQPDATNLCGLPSAPAIPFYIGIGAVLGASVAASAGALIVRTRKVRSRAIHVDP